MGNFVILYSGFVCFATLAASEDERCNEGTVGLSILLEQVQLVRYRDLYDSVHLRQN